MDCFRGIRCQIGFDTALKQAERLINQGAQILDVGEESTRPGLTSAAEEEDINIIWKITKLQIKRRSIDCF